MLIIIYTLAYLFNVKRYWYFENMAFYHCSNTSKEAFWIRITIRYTVCNAPKLIIKLDRVWENRNYIIYARSIIEQINRQIINYWFNFFRNEINLCYFCKRKKSLAEACLNRHCSFKTSWSMWSQDSSQRCKRVGERKTCSERGREGPSLPCAGLKKRWLL